MTAHPHIAVLSNRQLEVTKQRAHNKNNISIIILSSTTYHQTKQTNKMTSLSKNLLIDNDHVVNASLSTASSSSINNDSTVDDCNNKAIISTMLSQEKYYVSRPYLKVVSNNSKTKGMSNISSNSTSRSTASLDVACRTRVCKWMFHIIDIMGLQHETAAIAISYLDRFMSISCAHRHDKAKQKRSTTRCNRREYQLVASTSLYIAIKIHEPFVLRPEVISSLTGGLVTPDNIIACEKIILTTLRWRMNGPTPHQFINYLLKLLPSSSTSTDQELVNKLCESSHSWIETAIKDYACIPLRSSTVALSALLNSLEDISQGADHCLSSEVRYQFIQAVSDTLAVDNIEDSLLIKTCRKRLLDRSAKSCSGSEGVELSKPSKKSSGILESRVSSPVCASIEAMNTI